jgi:hypothetical protein
MLDNGPVRIAEERPEALFQTEDDLRSSRPKRALLVLGKDGPQPINQHQKLIMGPSGFEPESEAPKAPRITKLPHGPLDWGYLREGYNMLAHMGFYREQQV